MIRSRVGDGVRPQLIALSAVLGSLNGLDSWLGAFLLQSSSRPVPLDEGVLSTDGTYRYLDATGTEQTEQLLPANPYAGRAQHLLLPLTDKLVAEGQQIIVIRGERGAASGAAGYLAASLGLPPAQDAIDELPVSDVTHASRALHAALTGGVAFHSTDLGAAERRVVENHFRASPSLIRIVVSTTTLAQGVNLPAETVVLAELSRRADRGVQWFTVADYKNIVGRAGRLGLTDRGRAITLSLNAADAAYIWQHYVNGTPEDIHSTLLDPSVDLLTLVLQLIGISSKQTVKNAVGVDDATGILASSLAAHQARIAGGTDSFAPADIDRAITELANAGMLEPLPESRTRPTNLGVLVADSVLTVRSAVQVASALRRMPADAVNRATVLTLAQLTSELDELRLLVNPRGYRKELATYWQFLANNGVAGAALDAIQNTSDTRVAARRAKKAAACIAWVAGVDMGQLEMFVMQHNPNKNVSAAIRQIVSRTQDLISTIVAIASEIHPSANTNALADLLPAQLDLGVPSEPARLAVAGAELTRVDYMRLVRANLTDAQQILDTSNVTLLPLLANNTTRLTTLQAAAKRISETSGVLSADDILGGVDPNA